MSINMPNTTEQVTSQNDDAYRSKIDPQYLDKIPVGQARTYFENNPSKRLPEYLNEDYQGQLFNALSTCEEEDSDEEYFDKKEDFNVLLSIEDIIIKTINNNISENIVRAAKLALSIPDIYKQTYMLYLIPLVLKYQTKENEITKIFLKNASNYNGFKGVIRYITKGSANVEVQKKILSFYIRVSKLNSLNDNHF